MQLGERLGDRFELVQQVGTGGMGEVFLARDPATGEVVADKVISDARGHRGARFAREVELLAELSHPGIVRYISHGETPEGELYLVMEWLEGEDLSQRLEREPLTVGEAVQLVTRVAQALGAVHARGIVHRDLKPGNLFLPVGRIDQVKVLDFGIALRAGGAALTRTGVMIGTPGYMAPEQACDQGEVDARADVFARGCVRYMCLTGSPAFEGDSAIVAKILFGEAPDPHRRDRGRAGAARARGHALGRFRHGAVHRHGAARPEQAAVDGARARAARGIRAVPQALGRAAERP